MDLDGDANMQCSRDRAGSALELIGFSCGNMAVPNKRYMKKVLATCERYH